MSQLQFYKYTTISLVVLNALILAFFLLFPPPPPTSNGVQDDAIKAFDFTKEQDRDFTLMAKKHNQSMTAISGRQKTVIRPYFEQLIGVYPSQHPDSILSTYVALELEKVAVTFQHFEEIKLMLSQEQASDFKPFIQNNLDKILGSSKKNRPPSEGK